MKNNANHLTASITAWGLSASVVILAVIVWGNGIAWQFSGLSTYQLFPIFGLVAFSIMWSHYMVTFLNKTIFKTTTLGDYYRITGYVVLLVILLHPGLLSYQRFRDGFGLPLGSLTSYVQPSLRWVVLLGSVSFLAFLSFELRRWYKQKAWWKYIAYLNDAAMIAIFYHGLRLGSNLHGGWYEVVWSFYGLCLGGVLLYNYMRKIFVWHREASNNRR